MSAQGAYVTDADGRDYVDLVGLGYDVKTATKQTFPAFEGTTDLKYAKAG